LPEKRKPKKKKKRVNQLLENQQKNTCGVNLRTANGKAENVFVASTEEQEQEQAAAV
jgi:hypothetical protein